MSRRGFRGRGRCGAPGCRNPASCEECEACEECCICPGGAAGDPLTVRLDQEPWQDPDSMEDDDQPFFWNR